MSSSPASREELSFQRQIGALLRKARRRNGLTLLEVEAVTDGVYKASVLGAYERGQRSISVGRLKGLAVVYQVSVIDLVPGFDDVPKMTVDTALELASYYTNLARELHRHEDHAPA